MKKNMIDWLNLANCRETIISNLDAEKGELIDKCDTAVQLRKDADKQLVKILEEQKTIAQDLKQARDVNKQLSEQLT